MKTETTQSTTKTNRPNSKGSAFLTALVCSVLIGILSTGFLLAVGSSIVDSYVAIHIFLDMVSPEHEILVGSVLFLQLFVIQPAVAVLIFDGELFSTG
jgi:hypothetical protein